MALPEKPLTIRELAARLRVSAMTVSRALRNAPGVSAATRGLVLDAAAARGYRPDPALAVLNAYRNRSRHLHPRETVAFLTKFSTADAWRSVGTFQRYFAGAQTRAAELGYGLEHFWLGDPQLTDRRASQILHSRGIRGLIVGPLQHGGATLQLDWPLFTVVAVGRSLRTPAIATVSTNHFQSVELAWDVAWERGYRRIGLVLTREEEVRTLGRIHASQLLQQQRPDATAIPTLITPDFAPGPLAAWARRHQPDLVLGCNHHHFEVLLEALGRAGRRTKFLLLNANPRSNFAGIDQAHDKVGEHAMSVLHEKLIHRDVGIPARRELTLINGAWKEGRSPWQLPRRTAAEENPPQLSPAEKRQVGGRA
jgi:LacI family transcriptional regulator